MIRVLIVDDSATTRELIRAVLDAAPDIEVIAEATDGIEGVELTAKLAPDVVTMDVNMPQMNGLTFLQVIRKRFPELPVILMTGIRNRAVAAAASQHGATEYFKKPIRFEELLTCIKKVQRQIAA